MSILTEYKIETQEGVIELKYYFESNLSHSEIIKIIEKTNNQLSKALIVKPSKFKQLKLNLGEE